MRFFLLLIIGFTFFSVAKAKAKYNGNSYGLSNVQDTNGTKQISLQFFDSVFISHPMLATTNILYDIETAHKAPSQTADFYLLLILCIILGLIRFLDVRYFYNVWRAFSNPSLGSRHLKDQIQDAGLPNFLMNIFFTFSMGAYIYYIVLNLTPIQSGTIPQSLLIIMLICGTAIIYLAKYVAVRFSGWAFRVEGITEHYLFNVFLINKVLGITLLPFIIFLAFADHQWISQIIVISFVVVGTLFFIRYLRSWQVFGSFFQYSKFHFFMYLCASELLPIAVLMKMLVKGLLF